MSTRSKTPLILIEMTIMLLVFAVAAAVCLRLFSSARDVSTGAEELGRACEWAQSAADCYRASGGDVAEAAGRLAATMPRSYMFFLELDGDWRPVTGGGNASYKLSLGETGESSAHIDVVRAGTGEVIFSLDTEAVAYG